jgi:hypothetical protein
MALSNPQVRDLAKKGALARVEEIKAELSLIYQSFPELRGRASQASARNGASTSTRRRSRISAAGRERIRQAQLKRWAAVRAKKR